MTQQEMTQQKTLTLQDMTIRDLALTIQSECWSKSWYYAARPYVDALKTCDSTSLKGQTFHENDMLEMALYALSNLQSWRGELAREMKAELRTRIKETGYKLK